MVSYILPHVCAVMAHDFGGFSKGVCPRECAAVMSAVTPLRCVPGTGVSRSRTWAAHYRSEPCLPPPLLYIPHCAAPLAMSVEVLSTSCDCLDPLRPLLCGYVFGREALLTQTRSGLFQFKGRASSLGKWGEPQRSACPGAPSPDRQSPQARL